MIRHDAGTGRTTWYPTLTAQISPGARPLGDQCTGLKPIGSNDEGELHIGIFISQAT